MSKSAIHNELSQSVMVNPRSLISRSDFNVNITPNCYDDILFYERKALNLDQMSDYLNSKMLSIDMQMNLGEFLFKITPANISDKDLNR